MEKKSFLSECARRNEIDEMQKTVNWKQVEGLPPPIGSDGRMQSVLKLTILPPVLFVNVTTVASPQHSSFAGCLCQKVPIYHQNFALH